LCTGFNKKIILPAKSALFYSFLKIPARLALHFYCRHIAVNKKQLLKINGPVLLAVNHPNSFLDAIILCTLFNKPVYSLARGDAFKNKLAAKILYKLKILPVYRVSEGVENLEENYKTFDDCKRIFKQNGIVLIFSEGLCVNEWHLRPLKKGTARLAISSWGDGIDLKILPVGINYSSFKKFGKNINLFLGNIITKQDIDYKEAHGKAIKAFNDNLQSQLAAFVYEIQPQDKESLKNHFYAAQPFLKKAVLFIPAVAGGLIHAPLYYLFKYLNKKIVPDSGHFDSVMVGLLLLAYPLLLLLSVLVIFSITANWYVFLLLLILPFCAWACMQLKPQLD
jgi:1-acyl-sn-glycerol-3-phosphate acyltransferase